MISMSIFMSIFYRNNIDKTETKIYSLDQELIQLLVRTNTLSILSLYRPTSWRMPQKYKAHVKENNHVGYSRCPVD